MSGKRRESTAGGELPPAAAVEGDDTPPAAELEATPPAADEDTPPAKVESDTPPATGSTRTPEQRAARAEAERKRRAKLKRAAKNAGELRKSLEGDPAVKAATESARAATPRARNVKAADAQSKALDAAAKLATAMAAMTFAMTPPRFGGGEAVEESRELGEAWAPVLAPHLVAVDGEDVSTTAAIVTAALVTVQVFVLRAMSYREREAQARTLAGGGARVSMADTVAATPPASSEITQDSRDPAQINLGDYDPPAGE